MSNTKKERNNLNQKDNDPLGNLYCPLANKRTLITIVQIKANELFPSPIISLVNILRPPLQPVIKLIYKKNERYLYWDEKYNINAINNNVNPIILATKN